MPVLEQRLALSNGKIARLTLVQHPAQALSGRGVWPMRTQLVLWSHGAAPRYIPVDVRAETTVVAAADGRAGARLRVRQRERQRVRPRDARRREARRGSRRTSARSHDTFLRAMLWGALWDLVRDARLAPERFIAAALRELPAETDEQIASGIVTRMTRAASSYLSAAQQASLVGAGRSTCCSPARRTRRAATGCARISSTRTSRSRRRRPRSRASNAWLDSTLDRGLKLRQPTRWSIITHLVERGAPNADALIAREQRADTTTSGKRSAFVAGAARAVTRP